MVGEMAASIKLQLQARRWGKSLQAIWKSKTKRKLSHLWKNPKQPAMKKTGNGLRSLLRATPRTESETNGIDGMSCTNAADLKNVFPNVKL
jgi:hypothetical protein